jgi:hypothetical protein
MQLQTIFQVQMRDLSVSELGELMDSAQL